MSLLTITIRRHLWTYIGIGVSNLIMFAFHHGRMVKSSILLCTENKIEIKQIHIYLQLLKVKTESQAKRQVTSLV